MEEETNQNQEQNTPDVSKHHKWLWPLVVVLVLAAIGVSVWAVYSKQTKKDAESPVVVFDTEKEKIVESSSFSNWQTYRNEELGFEVRYPEGWGIADQGGTFIDFGPGKPEPAAGKIALDMSCSYNAETQIYGEETTVKNQKVIYGNNEFTERKIFTQDNDQIPSFHNFTINLPASYTGNACKTASFIVREEFAQNPEILVNILASFKQN